MLVTLRTVCATNHQAEGDCYYISISRAPPERIYFGQITMARPPRFHMPPANSPIVPTSFRPLPYSLSDLLLSEDVDEEDEVEEEEKKEVEQHNSLPPLSQDVLRLSNEPSEILNPTGGRTLSVSGLEADSNQFNPDWTDADTEFTSLAFGKKTALFVCKSTS